MLNAADVVRFFRRFWVLILGASATAAVTTMLALMFVIPRTYEASANLIVVPFTFKSTLKPQVLSVQGYQRLLESDAVIAETVRRLVAGHVLADDANLRLNRDLETRIFVSRRAEETALAPIIEAVARADAAEKAAAIANTWTTVFLEQVRHLFADSLSPTVELIEAQYADVRTALKGLESDRVAIANENQKRIDDASTIWNQRIIADRKETEDLVAAFHIETRRIMEDFAESDGLTRSPGEDQQGGERSDVALHDGEFERKLLQVLSLRIQLAQTPRFLVVEKAISDDTLWQAMALSQSKVLDLESVLDRKLLSQEANVVFNELALRLSELEIDLDGLSRDERRRTTRLTSGLERLQIERSAGLAKLVASRALLAGDLERASRRELDALKREGEAELGRINSDIENESALFEKLAVNYNEARIAKAEQETQEVRLGGPAVAPIKPTGDIPLKALVAAVLGGVFGVAVALVRAIDAS